MSHARLLAEEAEALARGAFDTVKACNVPRVKRADESDESYSFAMNHREEEIATAQGMLAFTLSMCAVAVAHDKETTER